MRFELSALLTARIDIIALPSQRSRSAIGTLQTLMPMLRMSALRGGSGHP